MRIAFTILFLVVACGGAVWVALKGRKQLETPQLATVAAMLGPGAQHDAISASGMYEGRKVEYRNRDYKSSRWTELSVDAADAKVGLEYVAPDKISGTGAAVLDADMRAQVTALGIHKIRIGKSVEIVVDRLIDRDADAQALVRLGVSLASRAAR